MLLPFADRNPTQGEIEKLRLVLSTYQDGTGMLATKDGMTLPGWRDFERAVATTFGGIASESKAVFDVALSPPDRPRVKYGLSCKMRRELNKLQRNGRAAIEMSNSAGKFWDHLATKGWNSTNYRTQPAKIGSALIKLVESWHQAVSLQANGEFDLTKSYYLVLSWNHQGVYQLHQFSLELPNPRKINWSFPQSKRKGSFSLGRRLRGDDAMGTVFEWYGESGGQLKYYPPETTALWKSPLFQLEPLLDMDYGIKAKAISYFPKLWNAACRQHENEVSVRSQKRK